MNLSVRSDSEFDRGVSSLTRSPRAVSSSPRAVSTVLDVALFVLLVSAAVGVIYAAPTVEDGVGDDSADVAAVATTLASTTATVEYQPRIGGGNGPASHRADRGSVAGMLATATVERAVVEQRFGGQRTPGQSSADQQSAGQLAADRQSPYAIAVENETRRALGAVDGTSGVQVQARWEPLPGADVGAVTTVGDEPPIDADVHAATVEVPLSTTRSQGVAGWNDSNGAPPGTRSDGSLDAIARADGCTGLADELARRVVGTLVPPEPTAAALRADEESAAAAADRYRAVAEAVGADPDAVPQADVRQTNAVLVDALRAEFETIVCDGYETPAAAARDASPDAVTIVVRRWSP